MGIQTADLWTQAQIDVFLDEANKTLSEIIQPKTLSTLSFQSQEIVEVLDPDVSSRGRRLRRRQYVNLVTIDGECDCYPSENGPLEDEAVDVRYLGQALVNQSSRMMQETVREQFNDGLLANLVARNASGDFPAVESVTVISCRTQDDCQGDPTKPVCDNFLYGISSWTCIEAREIGESCLRDVVCETGRCSASFSCAEKLSDGLACGEPDDCVSGVCSSNCSGIAFRNSCGGLGLNNSAICAFDCECSSGRCAASFTCQDKLSSGQSCGENDDCVSGNCCGFFPFRSCC